MVNSSPHLSGIFVAAVTPLLESGAPDLENLPSLLDFFHRRGCHGALLLGTTGEGPSFSPGERHSLLERARVVRQAAPDFHLMAGTGTPSLTETIDLTREAFDLGVDAVVVLPPYYFRKVTDDGLYDWYKEVLEQAVPEGKCLLGYHIPAVSGVALSLDLLARLKEAFPDRFAGIKDSSGDPEHAKSLNQRFGDDLMVFTGNDRLLSHALQNSASGCITALANIGSPISRRIWNAYQAGEDTSGEQLRLDAARRMLDQYPPAPPTLKALMAQMFHLPTWRVRPPLLPLSEEMLQAAAAELTPLLYE